MTNVTTAATAFDAAHKAADAAAQAAAIKALGGRFSWPRELAGNALVEFPDGSRMDGYLWETKRGDYWAFNRP